MGLEVERGATLEHELSGLPGSFLQHLLSARCTPGLGLDTGETAPSKADMLLTFMDGAHNQNHVYAQVNECVMTIKTRSMKENNRCHERQSLGSLV